MPVSLKLVPSEAAASIAARIKAIRQCEQIIRETVSRYDGLKAFEAELEKHGVREVVDAVLKRG